MSRSTAHSERNNALRERFSDLDRARAAAIPDAQVIPERAKTLGLKHEEQVVPGGVGAKIHWIGERSAKKIILYYHGGGYGLPAFDGHVIFLAQCAERLESQGHQTVIALLEYGLTKDKKYPTQFIQAVESLRAVLASGYHPEDIIIGGDSCGGNMAIAVMSIILHPHPAVHPLSLARPIAGLLLISAWVSFDSSSQAYAENNHRDIHMKDQMHQWAHDFCSEQERNNYTEPKDAPAEWFTDMPAVKTLNIFGGYEIFRDDINTFGQVLEKAGLDVENVECPLQVHIDCILDAQTGLEVGAMSTQAWRWLLTVFPPKLN